MDERVQIMGTYGRNTWHVRNGTHCLKKAVQLFPNNVSSLILVELQSEHGVTDKARLQFEASCHRFGSRSAEPYRLYAEFEMK